MQIFDEVTLGPLLGRGSFGRVHRGFWKGHLVAVKVSWLTSISEEIINYSLKKHPYRKETSVCLTHIDDFWLASATRIYLESFSITIFRKCCPSGLSASLRLSVVFILQILETFKRGSMDVNEIEDIAEARLVEEMKHPNIVRTYNHGTRIKHFSGHPSNSWSNSGSKGSNRSVRQTTSSGFVLETWLLLEYCNKGSLQVCLETPLSYYCPNIYFPFTVMLISASKIMAQSLSDLILLAAFSLYCAVALHLFEAWNLFESPIKFIESPAKNELESELHLSATLYICLERRERFNTSKRLIQCLTMSETSQHTTIALKYCSHISNNVLAFRMLSVEVGFYQIPW